MSHLVATDGSLLFVFGFNTSIDGQGQSDDACNATKDRKKIHVHQTSLRDFSREGFAHAFLSALAGSGNRLFPSPSFAKEIDGGFHAIDYNMLLEIFPVVFLYFA